MKFEFNERGKKEFAEPESWARSKKTIALVLLVSKGVTDDKLDAKSTARVNRWVRMGFCKKSGEERVRTDRTRTAAPTRAQPKKAKTKRTVKPKPETEQTATLITMAKTA